VADDALRDLVPTKDDLLQKVDLHPTGGLPQNFRAMLL
jgi:hypothetical protein